MTVCICRCACRRCSLLFRKEERKMLLPPFTIIRFLLTSTKMTHEQTTKITVAILIEQIVPWCWLSDSIFALRGKRRRRKSWSQGTVHWSGVLANLQVALMILVLSFRAIIILARYHSFIQKKANSYVTCCMHDCTSHVIGWRDDGYICTNGAHATWRWGCHRQDV